MSEQPGSGEASRWWDALITSDASPALPPRAPLDDPYGCGGLWERYTIRWILNGDGGGGGGTGGGTGGGGGVTGGVTGGGVTGVTSNPDDPALQQAVSPWEMFPAGATTEAALGEERSSLPADTAGRLLAAVRAARREPLWRLFAEAPGPLDAWELEGRVTPYNRVVALPFGLANLQVSVIKDSLKASCTLSAALQAT